MRATSTSPGMFTPGARAVGAFVWVVTGVCGRITDMKQYLLSICQPEGTPEPDVLAPVLRELDALNQEMRDAGVWVFAGGLHPPGTATVLRAATRRWS